VFTLRDREIQSKRLSDLVVGTFFTRSDIDEIEEWSSESERSAKLGQVGMVTNDTGSR
jgi:hypothetical protein